MTLLLVSGGLWEDMNADRFWVRPGVVAGLVDGGQHVLAPDRPYRAPSWSVEAQAVADEVPDADSVNVLAGSNGCSAAVRFALAEPGRVGALILAWPPVAGDPEVDARQRQEFVAGGATEAVIDGLLAGETLRGVTDAELAALSMRTAIIPSMCGRKDTSTSNSRRAVPVDPRRGAAARVPRVAATRFPRAPQRLRELGDRLPGWLAV